jgi:hypothetical protein
MAGHDEWIEIAAGEADDVRERILTGYKAGKPFTPYVPTLELPPVKSVLDFGCGLGRNFPYLKTIALAVDAYDLPPMVERCRALAPDTVRHLTSNWGDLRTRRYDLVFASLVLQHVETRECRERIEDFALMAPWLYLLTRARSDFDAPMLELVAESALFERGVCRVVDHDPATHQLRVLGELSFEAARRSSDDVHYELLLRSRAAG